MAQSPERHWRFDSSILYQASTAERRKLIASFITVVKGFELGSGYHRYIITNLSRNEGAQLDQVMKSCEAAVRKIQMNWPMCYPVSPNANIHQRWAVKFHNDQVEYLHKGGQARSVGGIVRLIGLNPRIVVQSFDSAGMIIMN